MKITLLQVPTATNIYLLDYETLPDLLTDRHHEELTRIMFNNAGLVKVGFGMSGDVRLLSRTFSIFSSLLFVSK